MGKKKIFFFLVLEIVFHFLLQNGANVIVSGSALVKHDNPREAIDYMRSCVNEAIQKSQLER